MAETNSLIKTDVKEREEKEEDEEEDAPDGGWGWFVVLGSFLCNVVLDGIAYSFGVLLQPMQDDLQTSVGSVSLIGGVLAGVILATGPLAAGAVNRFGSRVTCLAGSVISCVSLLVSSYCSSVLSLVLSYGLCTGVGLGLMYVPAVVAVGEYFTNKLALATGICVCGSGVGTFLLAPLTSSLCVSYGWRGSNRVMAALCLACSLCGLVMVPRKKRRQGEPRREEEQRSPSPASHCGLFTNTSFLLIMLGNIPFVMAIYTSYTYLPALAAQSGLSASNASFLISLVGISNTVGRLLSGWLADMSWSSPLGISITTATAVAVLASVLAVCSQFWVFAVVGSLYGLLLSSLITVTTPLIVQILGIQELNMAFGILTFARGVAGFLGPPVSGFILDNYSADLRIPFFLSSGLFLTAIIFYVWVWARTRHQTNKHGYFAI